jgi:hypothetical protein
MKSKRLPLEAMLRKLSVVLLAYVLLASTTIAWAQQAATAPATAVSSVATLSAAERDAAKLVKVETLREVTAALSAKEMEGRGTAQPGGERAARYIADRFAKLGLKPLGDGGTYLQAIKFKSSHLLPESSVKAGDVALKFKDEFVVAPPAETADASGGLVFVGYSIVSPELKRDDLAGLDLKGKIVMLLGGRPKNIDAETWKKVGSNQVRLGNLIQKGAAGFIFANVGTQQQPYAQIADYLSRRRVAIASGQQMPRGFPPFILISSDGADKLLAGSGLTFKDAMAKADAGEVISRDLNKPTTITVRARSEEATGSNVVGVLEGSDSKLKEQAIIYSAHYDAYGKDEQGRIFPGAADNALGVAMITAIAEGFAKAKDRPRRSIIFLAVTGEEYGLLGAEYWARNPTWPIEKVAADLNYDGIGTEIYGPVKQMMAYGAEFSDLGPIFSAVATASGINIIPDPFPEEGVFQRSDHFAFVKKGVPALMLLGGPEGDTKVWVARAKKWMETDYHQQGDVIRPDWNWEGARTSAVVGLVIGMRVASAEAMPAWLPSAPYKRS